MLKLKNLLKLNEGHEEDSEFSDKMLGSLLYLEAVDWSFSGVHLSSKFLGKEFTFTPRIPKNTYIGPDGTTTEDDITPRISIAPSIRKAVDALQGSRPTPHFFVYIVPKTEEDQLIDIDQNISDCPSGDKDKRIKPSQNPYGPDFKLTTWLDADEPPVEKPSSLKPSTLPPELGTQFKGCVPDAEETEEMWSVKPIRLIFVGVYQETLNRQKFRSVVNFDDIVKKYGRNS